MAVEIEEEISFEHALLEKQHAFLVADYEVLATNNEVLEHDNAELLAALVALEKCVQSVWAEETSVDDHLMLMKQVRSVIAKHNGEQNDAV